MLADRGHVTRYIEDFIFDLHQLDYQSELYTTAMFSEISELSMGPIRTLAAGACPLVKMFREGLGLFDEGRGVTACQESDFAELLAAIRTCH